MGLFDPQNVGAGQRFCAEAEISVDVICYSLIDSSQESSKSRGSSGLLHGEPTRETISSSPASLPSSSLEVLFVP
jgi:hypothetical protein